MPASNHCFPGMWSDLYVPPPKRTTTQEDPVQNKRSYFSVQVSPPSASAAGKAYVKVSCFVHPRQLRIQIRTSSKAVVVDKLCRFQEALSRNGEPEAVLNTRCSEHTQYLALCHTLDEKWWEHRSARSAHVPSQGSVCGLSTARGPDLACILLD